MKRFKVDDVVYVASLKKGDPFDRWPHFVNPQEAIVTKVGTKYGRGQLKARGRFDKYSSKETFGFDLKTGMDLNDPCDRANGFGYRVFTSLEEYRRHEELRSARHEVMKTVFAGSGQFGFRNQIEKCTDVSKLKAFVKAWKEIIGE